MKKTKIFLIKNAGDSFALVFEPQVGDTVMGITIVEVPKETDSSKILLSVVELVNKINELNVDKVQIEVGVKLPSELEDKLTESIMSMNVSTRLRYVLGNGELNTLKDVISFGKKRFTQCRNVGKVVTKEMEEILALNGLSWETEV